MSIREVNLDSLELISKYKFLSDLISDYVNFKYKPRCEELKNECDKLWVQIRDMETQKIRGSVYERLLINLKRIMQIICCIGLGVGFFGSLISFFMLTMESFLAWFLSISSVGFIGYKLLEKKLTKEANAESEKLEQAMSLMKGKLETCESELKQVNKILNSIVQTKGFFERYHPQYLRNKKFAVEYDCVFSEYLEKDISLLSILFLADNGRLPKKYPSEMTDDELKNIRMLSSEVDKELSANPWLFFKKTSGASQDSSLTNSSDKMAPVFSEKSSYVPSEPEWLPVFKPVRGGYVSASEPEEIATFESLKNSGRRR